MTPRVGTSTWAASRRRAELLRDRHDFAAGPLTLYLALLDVWEKAEAAARADEPADLPGWAATRVLPDVLAATATHGPAPLAGATKDAFVAPGVTKASFGSPAAELLAAWLGGVDLVPVERYLARATLCGPLAARNAGAACAADPTPRGGRRCPVCGGAPQLGVRTGTGDRLVSGQRLLRCARCAASWRFSSSACASCGESARRTVHSEQTVFPHLRLESCAGCRRYLVEVDLGRDPEAVPEVDELAALPLDLHAAERGLSKITPNLMGF
jgi:FdhE protein